MKPIEYQLVKDILEQTWTKSINTAVQNWTSSNCRLIKKEIEEVTDISISVRSIIRFAQLTESEPIKKNTTKYILAMYLNSERSNDGKYNTTAWDNLLKAKKRIRETPIPTLDGFEGKYQIHYKSKLLNDIQSDAMLEIAKNGNCIFRQTSRYKNRIWRGKAIKKRKHLFITLQNEIEFIYLIIKTTFENDYWVGIFLSIDDAIEMPNSPIVLVTKYDLERKDKQKRINLFFKQRGDNYRLSIDKKLLLVVNDAYDLERINQYLNEDIASVVGNWTVYTSHNNEIYYKSRMAINGSNDIVYESLRREYTGNIVIKNQDVYVYLNGEKNALLCFNLNYLKVEEISHIFAAYVTFSSKGGFPSYGSAVLIRSKLDFEALEKKEIIKNSPDYEILKQKKILEKLTWKGFQNFI